jgi:hypothetical protein
VSSFPPIAFEKDTAGIIAKADANWPKVKQQK